MKKFCFFLILSGLLSVNHSIAQCGQISMIGEFNDWNGDLNMVRDFDTFDLWVQSVVFTINDDLDGNGFVGMKFRENGNWANNWGNVDFPSGTGLLNGPYTDVPYGAWDVSFNCFTLEYNFQVPIGVDESADHPGEFEIYPNPATSCLTLDFKNNPTFKDAIISIYNINGQELMSHQISEPKSVIDVGSLTGGVYFVKMTGDKSIAIERLIKID